MHHRSCYRISTNNGIDSENRTKIKYFFSEEIVYSENYWHFGWAELCEDIKRWKKEIPFPDGICLEIGIGHHNYKEVISKLGYKWIGLDVLKAEGVDIMGDVHELPIKNDVFDLVVMRCAIEHFINPWKALSEVHRILQNDGYVCGTVSFLEPFHKSYYHFSHWGIEQLLKDTGFTKIYIKPGACYYLPLLFSFKIPAKITMALSKIIFQSILFLQKVVGKWYILWRFGRNSEEYSRFTRYIEENPLRYAGHITFLANKMSM